MVSPVSPIVANIHMEHFEETTLRTTENPPILWKRFVDNTFVVQYTEHKANLLQHITDIDSAIKFPVEDTWSHGSMPLLDTLVTPEHNGTLVTCVYRKPTCTDQYLH